MRLISICIILILTVLEGCGNRSQNYKILFDQIGSGISGGNLREAIQLADSIKKNASDEVILWKADSVLQIAERIRLDFSLNEEQIRERLHKYPVDEFSEEDLKKWESDGWLEYRIIDGEKRYFNRAASNLVLLKNFHLRRASSDSIAAKDKRIIFREAHTNKIISSDRNPQPSSPVSVEIIYTLTVSPDAVPDGETVRCWLPYPKEKNPRQKEVYLLGISNEDFLLAPDSSVHRTIYMENKAEKGKPVIFSVSYSYFSAGQYFEPGRFKILPYDKSSPHYTKYTSEELPQICFTDKVREIADSITGNEKDPYETVKKIYYWFSKNIPWAGALEYSIMPNIPEYVLKYRKGDCGMQTFLLMSMLRYKGIPVRWQSGWMIFPDEKNLHDWCEVWFEGTGWVPVDVSFGLQYSRNQKTKEFYISGIDAYRLTVNDGISGRLYPEKKYLRSEPYDFQRGEVEWSGGNLYFDKWDYEMKIEYK